jgi:hypothetical protein
MRQKLPLYQGAKKRLEIPEYLYEHASECGDIFVGATRHHLVIYTLGYFPQLIFYGMRFLRQKNIIRPAVAGDLAAGNQSKALQTVDDPGKGGIFQIALLPQVGQVNAVAFEQSVQNEHMDRRYLQIMFLKNLFCIIKMFVLGFCQEYTGIVKYVQQLGTPLFISAS